MKKYNGWTNWDTWNANLWLNNEYDLYKMLTRLETGNDILCLWLDVFGDSHDNIDVKEVNWEEILKNIEE